MNTKTLKVVAHLTAKSGRVEETRKVLMALLEKTRAEEGCIVYELMQNNADPADFTFVEEWSCDETLDAHLRSSHIQELVSRSEELLAGSADIRRYTLLG